MSDSTGLLVPWGWNPELQAEYLSACEEADSPRIPGRIISQREDTFTVMGPEGTFLAHSAGVFFHQKTSLERPGVGDWILAESVDGAEVCEESGAQVTYPVTRVLSRSSAFLREAPGGRGEAQIVACNVDKVLIVNPADALNLNRLERFATAIFAGGAEVAVVVSKADLVSSEQLDELLKQLMDLPFPFDVFVTKSAQTKGSASVENLEASLEPTRTYALVGASGAGKSTLVNALMREQLQETGGVREGDRKGRHVTSFRELFSLPSEALLMDTPGVREFAVWSDGDGLPVVFPELYELQSQCRFANCAHLTEPQCAVREALDQGKLSSRRLENWRSLLAELESNAERRQIREQRQERSRYRRKKKRDKRFSRPN